LPPWLFSKIKSARQIYSSNNKENIIQNYLFKNENDENDENEIENQI
jgi:hypothetical protein